MLKGDIIQNNFNKGRFAVVLVPRFITPYGVRAKALVLRENKSFAVGFLRAENWSVLESAPEPEPRPRRSAVFDMTAAPAYVIVDDPFRT